MISAVQQQAIRSNKMTKSRNRNEKKKKCRRTQINAIKRTPEAKRKTNKQRGEKNLRNI